MTSIISRYAQYFCGFVPDDLRQMFTSFCTFRGKSLCVCLSLGFLFLWRIVIIKTITYLFIWIAEKWGVGKLLKLKKKKKERL